MSPRDYVLVAIAIAAASVVQGVSGFGFSLTCMPLLSVILGVHRALAVQTTLGIVSNAVTAWPARRDVECRIAARIVAASIVGMPFGWVLLDHLSERYLRVGVGVVVGVLAVILASHVRIRSSGRAVDIVSGFISGVLSTSTGTNGPPLVVGLTGQGLPAARQRATLSVCFAVANVIVFGALLWNHRIDRVVMVAVASSLPVLVASALVGQRIFVRLQQQHYERVVIGLLMLSAAIAIISALTKS